MKKILGVISIVAGIFAGLYVGIWWAFIGGIMQLVDVFQTTPVQGSEVAWGVVRILFATSIGELVAGLLFMAGFSLIGWDFIGKRRKLRKPL